MYNSGLFSIEFIVFVALGTINTMSGFGYIQISPEDQVGMWMLFFALSGFILIHLLLTLMKVEKQSQYSNSLEVVLDRLLRQICLEDKDVEDRLIDEVVETILDDPAAYEYYLRNIDDIPRGTVVNMCRQKILTQQKEFGEDLLKTNSSNSAKNTYDSDHFFDEGVDIAKLESVIKYAENVYP